MSLFYFVWIIPIGLILNNILVNDNALLAEDHTADYVLAHKIFPFKSVDEGIFALRIVWGLIVGSIALTILIMVSRRIAQSYGVSLEQ